MFKNTIARIESVAITLEGKNTSGAKQNRPNKYTKLNQIVHHTRKIKKSEARNPPSRNTAIDFPLRKGKYVQVGNDKLSSRWLQHALDLKKNATRINSRLCIQIGQAISFRQVFTKKRDYFGLLLPFKTSSQHCCNKTNHSALGEHTNTQKRYSVRRQHVPKHVVVHLKPKHTHRRLCV